MHKVSKARVAEIFTWQTVGGIDKSQILKAVDKAYNDHLSKEPGFIDWKLLEEHEGLYMEVVYWDSLENAKKAADNAKKSVACRDFFKLMKKGTSQVQYREVIWSNG